MLIKVTQNTDYATQIESLKAGRTLKALKSADKKAYYKVQSLTAKLSEVKAAEKGQFVTKEDLVEFKGLIIWLMKNKTNYRGYLNLKNAMEILLNEVESKNVVYKTRRGIKGIVTALAISAGLEDVENNLRAANGLTVLDNAYGNSILENFNTFRLTALMN